MKQHPHAEVLRAIADGVPLSEFEVHHHKYFIDWVSLVGRENAVFSNETCWTIRRKQRTHVVNGFTVPAPMDDDPSFGDFYFTPSPYVEDYCAKNTWADFKCEKLWLKRGLCFATEEAAIANAKAMLKIDPEK